MWGEVQQSVRVVVEPFVGIDEVGAERSKKNPGDGGEDSIG